MNYQPIEMRKQILEQVGFTQDEIHNIILQFYNPNEYSRYIDWNKVAEVLLNEEDKKKYDNLVLELNNWRINELSKLVSDPDVGKGTQVHIEYSVKLANGFRKIYNHTTIESKERDNILKVLQLPLDTEIKVLEREAYKMWHTLLIDNKIYNYESHANNPSFYYLYDTTTTPFTEYRTPVEA